MCLFRITVHSEWFLRYLIAVVGSFHVLFFSWKRISGTSSYRSSSKSRWQENQIHSFVEPFLLYQTDIACTLIHLGFLITISGHLQHPPLSRDLAPDHSKVCSLVRIEEHSFVRSLNPFHFRLYDSLLWSYSYFIEDFQAAFRLKPIRTQKTALTVPRKRCVWDSYVLFEKWSAQWTLQTLKISLSERYFFKIF